MAGYNDPTVPWYAHPNTRPLRPKTPRVLSKLEDKIARGKYYQKLYDWVRANWSAGDYFYIMSGAPNAKNYSIAERYGVFRGMKHQGLLSRIFVDWLDDGHKINMEVITFYRFAVKINGESNVELPAIE